MTREEVIVLFLTSGDKVGCAEELARVLWNAADARRLSESASQVSTKPRDRVRVVRSQRQIYGRLCEASGGMAR